MSKKQFYDLLIPLIQIYDSIEQEMILDILERIDNYDGLKGSYKWYIDKLNELKVFEKNNVSIVNKNKKQIKDILKNIVKTSSEKAISVDTLETYNEHTKNNISIEDIYNSNSATNLIKEALKSTESICNLINTKAIESAQQEYQNILNTAYIETANGIYTYDQSIKRAIDKMAKNGILMANYDSGRSIAIESAVRRDVITRVNRLVGDIELETAKDLDTNLVYVDQHFGARTRTKYTKEDYEAHDEWQGKVYMIDGSDDKYSNFYEKTGYTQMLGLKGINCYHDFRPFFEWEEIPKPIDIEESKKERALLDKQREYERNIRTLKRQKIIAKKMGYEEDYKKANKKLIKTNKEYKSWLESNDKMRNYNREYVSTKISTSTDDKPNKSSDNNNYIDVTKDWLDNTTPNSHKVEDREYFEKDEIKYQVDGKNVVLDYSTKEKEVAEWLENTFGGEIYMLPRVNNPEGIQTADYLFRGEYWDLKVISGKSKQVLYHAIYKKKTQSSNFIFDVHSSELDINEFQNQIYKLYSRKDMEFLQKIILKAENDIFVYERNKKM